MLQLERVSVDPSLINWDFDGGKLWKFKYSNSRAKQSAQGLIPVTELNRTIWVLLSKTSFSNPSWKYNTGHSFITRSIVSSSPTQPHAGHASVAIYTGHIDSHKINGLRLSLVRVTQHPLSPSQPLRWLHPTVELWPLLWPVSTLYPHSLFKTCVIVQLQKLENSQKKHTVEYLCSCLNHRKWYKNLK